MCQCNCHNDPEAEQEVYNALFSLGILMANSRKEKENDKMGKIEICDLACKGFGAFEIGECFSYMENVYMKVKTTLVTDNAVNLGNGKVVSFPSDENCTPVHEFHWTDKK